jgi:hypothetical protein
MRFALALSDSLFLGPRGLQKVPVRHIPKKPLCDLRFLGSRLRNAAQGHDIQEGGPI